MASQISQSIRLHVAKGKANQLARPLHGHFGKPTLLWKMATEPDKAVDNTPDGVRAGSQNPQGEPPVWWRRSNPILHPLTARMPAGHALFYITLDKACRSDTMRAKSWFTTWRKRSGLKGPGALLVDSVAFRSSPSSAFKYAGGIRQDLQSKLDRTASRLVIENCAPNCGFLPYRVKFEARVLA